MTRPALYHFLSSPLSGPEIEARSFEIIDREAPSHNFSPDEWQIVRRMIHTAGDFSLMENVKFSQGAIAAAVTALRAGRFIYTDANMIRSGISLARLRSVCPRYTRDDLICYVADEEVARKAQVQGLPRSLFAVQKAKDRLPGSIVLIGNAPIALLEVNRLIVEDGVRPALVVGMPVGFVHVEESKEELQSLDIPFITLAGRRGGSPLAVSVLHALCTLADRQTKRYQFRGRNRIMTVNSQNNAPIPASRNGRRAVIILGHGSRAAGAADDMERVAAGLRGTLNYDIIATCHMSGMGALFPEVFAQCIRQGASSVLVLPYFLHRGMHILHDVPRMMREQAAGFPGVKVVLGRNLGFDETLVDIVRKRIRESEDMQDIRQAEPAINEED